MVHSCCTEWEKITLKMTILKISSQLMRHHLSSFFTFPICFKCLTTIEWSTIEFFGDFSYSCKRIRFYDGAQLVVVNLSATTLLIFKELISFAKLLETPLHCTFISNSWVKCIVCKLFANCCKLPLLLYDPFWTWIRKSLKFAFLYK